MHIGMKIKLGDEKGFAFVAALLATLIMVSLGILIFALTTRDIRTSIKSTGEKVAESAVESGIYRLILDANALNGNISTYTNASTTGTTTYSIGDPPAAALATKPTVRIVGASSLESGSYTNNIYNKRISGSDSRYGSQVSVDVGVEYYNPSFAGTGYR